MDADASDAGTADVALDSNAPDSSLADSGLVDSGLVDSGVDAGESDAAADTNSEDAGAPSLTFYQSCDGAGDECAADEFCTIFGFGVGFCVPGCETLGSATECRDGFSCQMHLSVDGDYRCQPETACGDGCDDASECVEIGCLGMWCVPASYNIEPRGC